MIELTVLDLFDFNVKQKLKEMFGFVQTLDPLKWKYSINVISILVCVFAIAMLFDSSS